MLTPDVQIVSVDDRHRTPPPNMGGFAGSVFAKSKDMDLATACIVACNHFILDEWCAFDPDRQIPLMMAPYWDVDATVKEFYRTAEKGAKSFTFPKLPDRLGLPSWHTDHWDPIFRAAVETNMSLSLHFCRPTSPLRSHCSR